MKLSDLTVAGVCLLLTALLWAVPFPVFEATYEGIDEERVAWSCGTPLTNLAPEPVDLDEVRAELAALDDVASDDPDGTTEVVESRHPQCAGLARTQVVLGGLSAAGGIWRGLRWWRRSAGARAERKFKRLHESAGKTRTRLF